MNDIIEIVRARVREAEADRERCARNRAMIAHTILFACGLILLCALAGR